MNARPLELGPLRAEVHAIEASDGVPLALTRLPRPGATPLVLVHGNFSKRNFWVSDRGVGLGAFLFERGFDVWIPELRGHGLSPKTAAYRRYSADDHARRDLPAVAQRVADDAGEPAHWLAHSAGGLFVMMALAAGWLPSERVRSVSLFGSQIDDGESYLGFPLVAPALRLLLLALGKLPARPFGLGPEDEPPAEMIEMIGWKSTGEWESPDGIDFRAALPSVRVPVQAFAGAGDRNDPVSGCRRLLERIGSPHKRFTLLGIEAGFSRDYGHVDMLVSKPAQREVWPRVVEWLERGHLAPSPGAPGASEA